MQTTDKQLNTPVALLIFKRPHTTAKVFEQIKIAKPKKLLIIGDGPRNSEEEILVKQAREAVKQINWDCEVLTNYSEQNMGCRLRVSSGLNWVFKQVDKAIILEDDCLPNQSFFRFCEELLLKYEPNPNIMHISGVNFQPQSKDKNGNSYYFSRIPQIWGWATWRRAWKYFDMNMSDWPQMRENEILKRVWGNTAAADYWEFLFNNIYKNQKGKADTWDAQWVYACFKQQGLCINPVLNLISNIGFGEHATRTQHLEDPLANLPSYQLDFPLKHPAHIKINKSADDHTLKTVFRINNTIFKKTRWFVKKYTPAFYDLLRKIYRFFSPVK